MRLQCAGREAYGKRKGYKGRRYESYFPKTKRKPRVSGEELLTFAE